jgi:NAD(P)-dependent dehydrogenase (short-subunit alcohol dehydrogenase family)
MKTMGLVKNISGESNVNFLLQSARLKKGERVAASRFVLITGASTGIGAACAIGCAARGMTVFAGVRNLSAGDALRAKAGTAIIPVQLDVTDGGSITKAAELVSGRVGEAGLSGLVNNAGIAIGSPLECIPLHQLRRQLEVNVVGQIAVTQAVLPLLRRGRGRIVNMGSIAGRGTIPMMGPYSASKHALEALTDALRMELYPWGIEVSIIEPGAIDTPIWNKSMQVSTEIESELPIEGRELYQNMAERIKDRVGLSARRAIPADAVVEAVLHALTAKRPKTRYLVGRDAKLRAVMLKWLPDRLHDWLLKKILNLP